MNKIRSYLLVEKNPFMDYGVPPVVPLAVIRSKRMISEKEFEELCRKYGTYPVNEYMLLSLWHRFKVIYRKVVRKHDKRIVIEVEE